jgi:hypothetical protein
MALGVAASISSCRNDITDPVLSGEELQLTLLPSVERMNEEAIRTRAAGNSFFENGDEITVKITTSRTGALESKHSYTYGDGTFTGGFYFSPDNTYISELEALWPAEGSEGRSKIIIDQRKYEDYKQADRLKATANTTNIMPTAEPVPLVFTHEHSSLTFRLAGQNANGLIIKTLLLELKADLDGEGEKGVGFWAYCDTLGDLNAKMILPAGVHFGPEPVGTEGRMMIGLVTVGEADNADKDYRGVIYIPNSTNIDLEANHDYLVTLTPEGYDLFATISISGFSQSEGRVALPFQLPVLNEETGKYEISTVAQLITISWLLEGDLNGESQEEWNNREFDIINTIVVSDKVKAEGYLKDGVLYGNKDKFTGTVNVTYSNGTEVFAK